MARNIITFELRKDKDDDIATALDKAITVENDRSSIIRVALRKFFHPDAVGSSSPARSRVEIEAPKVSIILQEAEKDDAQLDDALDSLLNF